MDWIVSIADAVASGTLPNSVIAELEKSEFCATESACLDFKRDGYSDDAASMAEATKDIAALYNTYGGFIVFGVAETEKDVRYQVSGVDTTPFNMQQFRGKLEAWLSEPIPLSYSEVALSSGFKVGVLFVNKREKGKRPNEFKRRGPELRPGRYVFEAGSVALRRSDKSVLATEMYDWQLVLGDRELDSLGKDVGRLIQDERSGSALDHNLPSRATICARFIGRSDVLTKLWAWLNDEFQYAQLIAGEGGKGKTSLAYEFATQVAYNAPHGIERIVWLTAKKKQFSGIENTWHAMPETHFQCFRTMLVAIGRHLGYTDEELEQSSEPELQRMVRSEIGIQPTLFVLDDIDSLPPDDQRRALEFAQQAGSYEVRFLLTTRSNASYSSSLAVTLEGLAGEDYAELVAVLEDRFGMKLENGAARRLESATHGSPLLTESILRVVKRGSPLGRAIDEWKGHSGEDARNAILGREIAQLSREAQRVLLCLAFFGQCSKAELMSASGMLEIRLGEVLEELQSLFIVNAPKIIASEPRFELSLTTSLLVVSKRSDLAGDHVAIENRIKKIRSNVLGATQKRNKNVAIAISQALALIKIKNFDSALATIDAALKSQKNHPDLLLFKGRLLCESVKPDRDLARKLFSQAYDKGARKHILFDLWYKCERELAFGHGVIEVAEKAMAEFGSEQSLWAGRRAEGFVLNGVVRFKNREYDQAFEELSQAAEELRFAIRKSAVSSERDRFQELMYGVHDRIRDLLPRTKFSRTDVISAIRDITDREDVRGEVISALGNAILQAVPEMASRGGGADGQRERLENNRLYALDLLTGNNYRATELFRKLSVIRFLEY